MHKKQKQQTNKKQTTQNIPLPRLLNAVHNDTPLCALLLFVQSGTIVSNREQVVSQWQNLEHFIFVATIRCPDLVDVYFLFLCHRFITTASWVKQHLLGYGLRFMTLLVLELPRGNDLTSLHNYWPILLWTPWLHGTGKTIIPTLT